MSAGFIRPECSARRHTRARLLEDVVMPSARLTMGLDVCSTFHMGIGPAVATARDDVSRRALGPGIPHAVRATPTMLGYLTTFVSRASAFCDRGKGARSARR